MREMTDRLVSDDGRWRRPTGVRTSAYLAERDAIEPLGTEVSAGGMPTG